MARRPWAGAPSPLPGPFGSSASVIVNALAGLTAQWADHAYNAEAKRIADEEMAAGLDAGRQAALSGQPLETRPDDDTVAGGAYNQGVQKGYLLSAANDVRNELSAAAQEHEGDPAALEQRIGALRERYQGLPAQVQVQVQAEIDEVGGRYLHGAKEQQRKRAAQQHVADGLELLDKLRIEATQGARLGDSAAVAAAKADGDKHLDSLVAGGYVTGLQANALRRARDNELIEHAVLGEFDRASSAGGIAGARAFLTEFRGAKHPGLDPDKYDALSRRMDAWITDQERDQRYAARETRQQQDEDYRWRFARLVDDAEAGRAGLADIEVFGQQVGWRKPADWKRAKDAVDRYAASRQKDSDRVDAVTAVLKGESLGGEIDQPAVDTHFKQIVLPRLGQDATAEDAIQAAAENARSLGVLPSFVQRTLANSLRGGDAERKAWAAQQVAKLAASAPAAADRAFSKDILRQSQLMGDYLSAGLSPKDAAERVDARLYSVGDGARKQRESALTKKALQESWTWAASRSGLRSDQGFFSAGAQGLDDPATATSVRADFELFLRDAYLAHGDMDAARAEAVQEVRKRWSVSRADGSARWMRYAPEAVYGLSDLDASGNAEWMRTQLESDVRPLAGQDAAPMLMSDQVTARAMSAGQPPTYRVLIRDSNGVINELRHPDGGEFRWRPDKAAHAKTLSEGRQQRARDEHGRFVRSLGPLTAEDPAAGTPASLGLP